MVYLYTTMDEAVNPLTTRKYTVLNGNFGFDLRDAFQEGNPAVKRDLPVFVQEKHSSEGHGLYAK